MSFDFSVIIPTLSNRIGTGGGRASWANPRTIAKSSGPESTTLDTAVHTMDPTLLLLANQQLARKDLLDRSAGLLFKMPLATSQWREEDQRIFNCIWNACLELSKVLPSCPFQTFHRSRCSEEGRHFHLCCSPYPSSTHLGSHFLCPSF